MKGKETYFQKYLLVCLTLILIITISVLPSYAQEPEYEWKLSIPTTGKLRTDTCNLFADLANFYSDGKIEIEVFPDGTIGGSSESFHGVQEGSIEMAVLAPYVDTVPGGMVNWMPWTIGTYDESAVAFSYPDGVLFKIMTDAWAEVGFHYLFNIMEGPYGLSNDVRPIKTPADLKNLKFRVSSSLGVVQAMLNFGEGTGFTVVTLPWSDLYNALERGVVDGCWDWPTSLVQDRHFEVMKYHTALNYLWGLNHVTVNKDKWDNLPAEIQEALIKAAQMAELQDYEVHRRNDSKNYRIAEQNGMEIYFPTPEERAMFKEKSRVEEIWNDLCKPWLEKTYPDEENITQKVIDELNRIQKEY